MDDETHDPDELAAWDAPTTTLVIERLDGGPRLVIEEADALIYASLAGDAGARSFDAWARAGRDPDLVTHDDLVAINRLGARSPHVAWAALTGVLDRLVVEQLGGAGTAPLELVDHLRRAGRENRVPLALVGANLEKVHLALSPVRILDAALWASHPAAGAMPRLGRWTRRAEAGVSSAS